MYNTYPQNQNFGPQHNGYGYAPMQQPMQQMPMQQTAPVAQSSVGEQGPADDRRPGALSVRPAFGGVFLMNSSSQPEQTAASQPSTVFNIPSEINIPGLNTDSDPASPVVVNNPAPIRIFTPSTSGSNSPSSTKPAPRTGPGTSRLPPGAHRQRRATTGTTGTTGTTDDAKKSADDAAAKKAADDAAAKKAADDAAAKKAADDAAAKKAADDAAAKKSG